MAQRPGASFIALLLTALVMSVQPDTTANSENPLYKDGDRIPLFANKIFPADDPCDALPYFHLPFCPPGSIITNRKRTFEEVLAGDCFTNTQYELTFKKEKIREILCEKNLTKDEVAKFRHAAENRFEFVMYYNSIRLQTVVGKVVKALGDANERPRGQVMDMSVMCDFDSDLDVTEDVPVKVNFTYSVFWRELNESSVNWPTEQGDWENILMFLFRACIIVIWIGLLLEVAMQYLSGYFTRYSDGDIEEAKPGKINMKQIHGDSCRCPPYPSLLGAVLGVVSGYIATSFHVQFTAIGWKECIFQTGVLYSVPVFLTVAYVATIVAIGEGVVILPKFGTVVTIFVVWALCTTSLLTLGGNIGYAYGPSESQAPCTSRSRAIREVPRLSWYMRTPAQMFLGGILPFLAVFLEMDNIYASLWSHKVCGTFSTLVMAFVLAMTLTVIISMFFAHLQQLKQDNQWWWRGFGKSRGWLKKLINKFNVGLFVISKPFAAEERMMISGWFFKEGQRMLVSLPMPNVLMLKEENFGGNWRSAKFQIFLGPRMSWCNGHEGVARRWAKLDQVLINNAFSNLWFSSIQISKSEILKS
ncbi:transmembrane 9 superfamily member 2-like [Malania oleifera]|uniref:transmembrane 9 superfamily member 2-like n=1 Tax=Malania oleifera TaxID=397392 RepID=UPI0025AE4C43|nr:transmembrane 9 superfamily member 2-like [Malania oleifera]